MKNELITLALAATLGLGFYHGLAKSVRTIIKSDYSAEVTSSPLLDNLSEGDIINISSSGISKCGY